MEDRQIVDLFFERSEQAITELSRKYGGVCTRLARNILNNEQDAEECVNDARLAVWNTVPPRRPDPLLTYVCRIVRNLAVKRYHANTAAKRNSAYDLALDELAECLPARETVEGELSARELSRLLDQFLDTLDREDRVLFVRRYWYSDPVSDLAARYHISANNLSVRLSRIRGRLRTFLREKGVEI